MLLYHTLLYMYDGSKRWWQLSRVVLNYSIIFFDSSLDKHIKKKKNLF